MFGVIFVVVLLVLAVAFPSPTPFQYTVFRVVLSLAAAGVGAVIPGFFTLSVAKWIRAGGALAVFAVVYFYSPASMVSSPASQTNETKGNQNQVINGNSGTVSITNDKKASEAKGEK